jgi:hypothetical protein
MHFETWALPFVRRALTSIVYHVPLIPNGGNSSARGRNLRLAASPGRLPRPPATPPTQGKKRKRGLPPIPDLPESADSMPYVEARLHALVTGPKGAEVGVGSLSEEIELETGLMGGPSDLTPMQVRLYDEALVFLSSLLLAFSAQ